MPVRAYELPLVNIYLYPGMRRPHAMFRSSSRQTIQCKLQSSLFAMPARPLRESVGKEVFYDR